MEQIQVTFTNEPWWIVIWLFVGVIIGSWIHQLLRPKPVAQGEDVAMAITKAQEEKRQAEAIADGFLDMIDDFHVHGVLDDKAYEKWYNRVKNVFTLYDLDPQRKPLKERLKILKHRREQEVLNSLVPKEPAPAPVAKAAVVAEAPKPKVSLLKGGRTTVSSKAVAA